VAGAKVGDVVVDLVVAMVIAEISLIQL